MPMAMAALAGVGCGASGGWVLIVFEILALIGLLLALWQRAPWPALAMIAALYCAHGVETASEGRLPTALAGHDFRLVGTVEQLDVDARRARFRLRVRECRALDEGMTCPPFTSVRLSWYGAPALVNGERWSLSARLREPLGFANPDTFDYDAWLWREGVQALGYVRDSPPAKREAPAPFSLRHQALGQLDAVSLSPRAKRWLAALTLGASERLTDEDWALFNATGTTHLMVISGLHIGLIATLALLLLRRLARLVSPWRWRMAAWPWWGAGVAAFGYAALAGFGPPALRAAIMACVGLWAASGRHAPGWWQAWWLALALIVIADPLAPWRPGLWLSFGAVAVLIVAWSGRPRPRGLRGWIAALLRTQWLLAPLMAAAVLLAFGRLSPVSPLVNLVVVPLVSSIMVPIGFLGWLASPWPAIAAWAWWPFDQLVQIVAVSLSWVSAQAPLWTPSPWWRWPIASGLLIWGVIWLIPGLALRTRLVPALVIAVLMVTLQPPRLGENTLIVTVHDVGQGQLVELRTRYRRVLIDTGPRFASGFMPAALQWPPGQQFDDVVVTHSDIDHAGGVEALLRAHRVSRWWAPRGNALAIESQRCLAGERWQDPDGTWQFLSPPPHAERLERNDRSCVMLITIGGHRVLITGDASAAREAIFAPALESPVDLLVAGHHGSETSSSPALIEAARPREVVFSSGRGNPFGHPAPSVVARFIAGGSRVWNTAYDGAIRVTLSPDGIRVQSQRHPGWGRRMAVDAHAVGVESSP